MSDKYTGMNDFLRKLRAPTMTAHNAPGGGDTQLADVTETIADETNDAPYTPPLPVPIGRPEPIGDENRRGESSEVWLVNPPATLPGTGKLTTGEFAEKGSQFPINSIRVDNNTSQWMYWPENGVFVPPFWYGRVFRYTGSRVQRVRFETPTGLTALAAATTEIARVVFSNEYWDEQSGGSITANIGASAGAPPTTVAITDESGAGLFAEIIASNADALATQDALVTADLLYALNSNSTSDRLRSGATNADGVAAITAGALMTNEFQYGWAGTTGWIRLRVPNIFKNLGGVTVNAGSISTVWTPAAGLKPRLMGWVVDGSSALVDAPVTFFETSTTGTFMGTTGFISGTGAPSYVNFLGGGPIVSTSSAVIVAFSSQAVVLWGTLFGVEE